MLSYICRQESTEFPRQGREPEMKCSSQVQAERMAFHGANKMDAAGYTYEQRSGGQVLVFKPLTDDGRFSGLYVVQTNPAVIALLGGVCDCPFAVENAEYGTCKHSVWVGHK